MKFCIVQYQRERIFLLGMFFNDTVGTMVEPLKSFWRKSMPSRDVAGQCSSIKVLISFLKYILILNCSAFYQGRHPLHFSALSWRICIHCLNEAKGEKWKSNL